MNLFLILSTCFIVVLSSPGRARAEKPEEFLREGLEHFKQGRDVEAVRAFRSAADADDVAATGFLGWMYLKGKGVPRSSWIAFGYFMDAAERGDGPACLNLGTMYFNGAGIKQDNALAVRWWEKDAGVGEYRCAGRLAHLLYSGDGVAMDRARAIELWGVASRGAPPGDKKPAIAMAFAQIMTGGPKSAQAARKRLDDLARAGDRAAIDAAKYLAARGNRAVLLLDVPHIQQAHNYCAPASAAMMLRYQGIEVSQFDVHRLCPNTKVGAGVYWSDLLVAADKCGGHWEIKTHAATDAGFAEAKAFVVKELSAGRPLIIDWFDKTNAHTVVLCGYDENAKEFFFRNTGLPYPGIHVRSESWLKKNWATRGYTRTAKEVRRAAIRIVPDHTFIENTTDT